MRHVQIILVLLLLPSVAFAQTVATTDYSGTLGTSPVQCVPADTSRKTLWIENPAGNSNNVGYCIGATCVPSIGAAGTSVLTPGAADSWGGASYPSREAIQCVGSGATTPVTIRGGK